MPKRRRLSPGDYTVGWICALPIELAAAQKMIDEKHEPLPQADMNPIAVYTLGRIRNHNVVITCLPAGRIGPNTMGAMAKEMSYAFPSIRFSLLVGIGSGVPSKVADVRLGDVVATTTGFELSGALSTPPNVLLSAVSNIKAHHAHQKNSFKKYLDWVVDGSEFAVKGPETDVLFESTYIHVTGNSTCESCDRDRQVCRGAQGRATALIHRISEFDDPVTIQRKTLSDDPASLPCDYLPFRAFPHFWGRQEDLARIGEYLDYDPTDEQLRSLAIWGVPGVGKSQTAFAYAKQKKEELDAVFWVCGETELQLDEGFSEISIKLKLPKAPVDSSHAHNRYLLRKWLSQTKAKWLLVFDNIDNPEILANYWPKSLNGSILITCRSSTNAADPAAEMMQLEPFDDEHGGRLLLHLAGRKTYSDAEKAASEELSNQVGGLALALVTLAHQIKIQRTRVQDFLPFYTTNYREVLEDSKRSGIYYQNSVPVAFQLTFRLLKPNTKEILALFSLLAPNDIPETLFSAEFAPSSVKDSSRFSFLKKDSVTKKALQELLDNGLVYKDIETGLFTVHRLIQIEFRDRMDSAALLDAFKVTIGLLYERLAGRYEQMFLVKHLEGEDTPEAHIETLPKLLASAAWYLHEGNSYHTALQLIGVAFRSCKHEDSLTYARLSNVAGCITSEQGKFDLALTHYQRALDIRKRLLPKDYGELADTYNNIALCYQAMDRMPEAFSHLRIAIEIDEMKTEEDPEQVGHLRHLNLADMYMQQGDMQLGAPEPGNLRIDLDLVRAEIDLGMKFAVQYFGLDSHFVASADASYGHLAELEGSLKLALEYYEAAYQVYQNESAVSPAVSKMLYRIGRLHVKQQSFALAAKKLQQALLVSEYNEPNRGDKGDSARIMRKLADALKEKVRRQLQGTQYEAFPDDDLAWDALVDVIFR
ncbi:hypothetical protein BDW74DRAFT_182494 [Aspergillus multicolor]|uniref:uncharacterized protein n=1 Tax=Aspergillus multicolor TaxID=41759 RepID=UPI003CCD5328